MIVGIVGGILIDILGQPIVVVKEVGAYEEIVLEPKEVRIEVVMDHSPEAIEEKIREVFYETPNTAVAVAKCESGLKANIQSQHILSYGQEQSYGVFQIHAPDWEDTASKLGLDNYKTNALENIELARYIYERYGWSKWMCYTKGLYKDYL